MAVEPESSSSNRAWASARLERALSECGLGLADLVVGRRREQLLLAGEGGVSVRACRGDGLLCPIDRVGVGVGEQLSETGVGGIAAGAGGGDRLLGLEDLVRAGRAQQLVEPGDGGVVAGASGADGLLGLREFVLGGGAEQLGAAGACGVAVRLGGRDGLLSLEDLVIGCRREQVLKSQFGGLQRGDGGLLGGDRALADRMGLDQNLGASAQVVVDVFALDFEKHHLLGGQRNRWRRRFPRARGSCRSSARARLRAPCRRR